MNGFAATAPVANKKALRHRVVIGAKYFREHGVMRVVEYREAEAPDGKDTSFPLAAKREPGEAELFSWIEWPDKATSLSCFGKMMQAPMFDLATNPLPLDGGRQIFGGRSHLSMNDG